MLYCIYRNSKMCRNLFIRPSLTCKHGNGKFHRRKFIRYFLFRFIIMYHHPASAEKKDSICNLPVSIRIILPDTRLNQPAQKTMVFNKRLNEIIHFGKIPSLHKFRLRFLHILPVDPTHRHHTPDVDHTDRINVIRHKQCSLTHSISTPVLPVQIHLMRHHINRKQPQPLRKHPAIPLQRRNPLCRKMQKNNTSIPGQNTNRLNLLRSPFTFHQLHTLLNPLQTTPRRSRITKRKIRIAIKYTRRKPQLYRLILKIRLRNLTTFLRPARKIKKLSPGNIPEIAIFKPLHNLHSRPRFKSRIQKWQHRIFTHTSIISCDQIITPLQTQNPYPQVQFKAPNSSCIYINYNPKPHKNKFKLSAKNRKNPQPMPTTSTTQYHPKPSKHQYPHKLQADSAAPRPTTLPSDTNKLSPCGHPAQR